LVFFFFFFFFLFLFFLLHNRTTTTATSFYSAAAKDQQQERISVCLGFRWVPERNLVPITTITTIATSIFNNRTN
jgi:hypothetical protein